MNLFRPLVLFISFQLLVVASCQTDKVGAGDSAAVIDSVNIDSALIDSDALILSLTPTVECLPLYYAQKAGFYKTLGLKVSLKTYHSQFDCDTAMLGNTAIGGASDLIRLHYYAEKGLHMSAVSSLDGQWSLLTSKELRIKKISLLQDRMIAVGRFSSSDFHSNVALQQAGMEYDAAFRPQINDYYLREAMLKNHQVDAAVLPEPFATLARLKGHEVLYHSSEETGKIGCLMFKPSVLAVPDSALLVTGILKGYNMAVEELNKKGKSVCSDILQKQFHMPKSVIDSLVLPVYRKSELPSEENFTACRNFMKNRESWSGRYTSNDMMNKNLIPE